MTIRFIGPLLCGAAFVAITTTGALAGGEYTVTATGRIGYLKQAPTSSKMTKSNTGEAKKSRQLGVVNESVEEVRKKPSPAKPDQRSTLQGWSDVTVTH
jgi:microcompartment protein CcmL/EutN